MVKSHTRFGKWFRFRLKTLLIATSVLAVWFGLLTHRAKEQKIAVETIERSGGGVWCDFEVGGHPSEGEIPGPEWLRNLIGEHYFITPTIVAFYENTQNAAAKQPTPPTPISTETLVAISRLSSLSGLKFYERPVRLADLAKLTGLPKLKSLRFTCAPASSHEDAAQLSRLGQFTELRFLFIANLPDVTGQLSFLRELPKLTDLLIESEQLAPEDLSHIGTLTQLEYLDIESAELGAEDLSHIGTLTRLECLILRGTSLDSPSLAHLVSLKSLIVLDLGTAQVQLDDTLMDVLASLESLKYLTLPKASIGTEELEELNHILPRCSVTTR